MFDVTRRTLHRENTRRHTPNHGVVRHALCNNRIGANCDIIPNLDVADDDCAWPDKNVVPYLWRTRARTAICLAYRDTLRDIAVFPNDHIWIDHDSTEMADIKSAPNTRSIGDVDAEFDRAPFKYEQSGEKQSVARARARIKMIADPHPHTIVKTGTEKELTEKNAKAADTRLAF